MKISAPASALSAICGRASHGSASLAPTTNASRTAIRASPAMMPSDMSAIRPACGAGSSGLPISYTRSIRIMG